MGRRVVTAVGAKGQSFFQHFLEITEILRKIS
jgi:hypothetical protein